MPVPEEPPQRPVASFQTIRPFGRTNSLADGGLGRTHDLHGRFCSKPFDNFEINPDGSVAVCCHAWLPQKIGNIAEQGLWEVWNSDIAQRIRASILDGSYRYCVAEECGAIQAGTLPKCAEVQDPRHRTYIDQQLTKLDEPPFLFNPSVRGYDIEHRAIPLQHDLQPELSQLPSRNRPPYSGTRVREAGQGPEDPRGYASHGATRSPDAAQHHLFRGPSRFEAIP
jgi:hypothetical protein